MVSWNSKIKIKSANNIELGHMINNLKKKSIFGWRPITFQSSAFGFGRMWNYSFGHSLRKRSSGWKVLGRKFNCILIIQLITAQLCSWDCRALINLQHGFKKLSDKYIYQKISLFPNFLFKITLASTYFGQFLVAK